MRTTNTRKNISFKEQALEIVGVFEISFEQVGFPQSEIENVNAFYDVICNNEEEIIKRRIMMLHLDFFGGTNFKNRDDPHNKQLMETLLEELVEIKILIDTLNVE